MKLRKLKDRIDGLWVKFYPITIQQGVFDEETDETLDVTLTNIKNDITNKANHGYVLGEGEEPKTLKEVDEEKALHGYSEEEEPKTLKEVDDNLAQLAGDVSDLIISPKKTDFILIETGKNLYDKNSQYILKNSMLDSNGNITTSSTFEVTDYLKVHEGRIAASRSGGSTSPMFRSYAFYDSNKEFISGVGSGSHGPIDIPSGVAYMRVTHDMADIDYQLEMNYIATEYEEYYETYYLSDDIEVRNIDADQTSFIENVSLSKNKYNPSDTEKGAFLNLDGTTSGNVTYEVTGYMPVEPYQQIYVSRSGGSTSPLIRTHVWYDSQKMPIGGDDATSLPPIQSPDNAAYLRISHNPEDTDYQVEASGIATPYEPYIGGYRLDRSLFKNEIPDLDPPLKNKTLIANGDSIMDGGFPVDPTGYETPKYRFIDQVRDEFSLNLHNYAIGASTIAVDSADPTRRTPIVSRYQDMDDDGDIIIIAGGTNDWANSWTPIGDMSDRTDFTFYGALHNLCLGLLDKYLGKQIVFMTPIKRSYGSMDTPESTNSLGKTLQDYADIIIEVCSYYGIPVIDMFRECTLNPTIQSQRDAFVPDGTHPNTEGNTIMARRVIGYLRQLM